MEFASVHNSNNRNLQKHHIRGFNKKGLKAESRPIRKFPEIHPKEAAAYRKKIKKEARKQQTISIIAYVSIAIITAYLFYLIQ